MVTAATNLLDTAMTVNLATLRSGLVYRYILLGGLLGGGLILLGGGLILWFTGGRELLQRLAARRE